MNSQQQEEEILTPYEAYEDRDTLAGDDCNSEQVESIKDPRLVGWEFKIVRAKRDLFRDPEVFQSLCIEEAEAGWILLEKLDDRRVRFKRPIALREIIKPEFLSFDPYRCSYSSGLPLTTLIGAIAVAIAVVIPAYLGYTLVAQALSSSATPSLQSFPPVQQPSRR